MQDFLSFARGMASVISGFLLSEPIVWFVALFLLAGVIALFHRLTRVS